MKPLSILFVITWMLFALGCADPLEKRSGAEVQSQLERGLQVAGGRLGRG